MSTQEWPSGADYYSQMQHLNRQISQLRDDMRESGKQQLALAKLLLDAVTSIHERLEQAQQAQQGEASGAASLPTSEQLSGKACRVCGHYFDDFEPSFEWCCASCEQRQATGEIPRLPIVREWLHQDLASEARGDETR